MRVSKKEKCSPQADELSLSYDGYDFVEKLDERRGKEINSKLYKELTRDLWGIVAQSLEGHIKGEALDNEVANWLVLVAYEAANGICPSEITSAVRKGTPKDNIILLDAKKTCVLYIQASKAGDKQDPSPIKTMSKRFSCSEQAIRDWIKRFPDNLWENFSPDQLVKVKLKRLEIKLKHAIRIVERFSRTHEANQKKVKLTKAR